MHLLFSIIDHGTLTLSDWLEGLVQATVLSLMFFFTLTTESRKLDFKPASKKETLKRLPKLNDGETIQQESLAAASSMFPKSGVLVMTDQHFFFHLSQ
jgi:hypothetical protein